MKLEVTNHTGDQRADLEPNYQISIANHMHNFERFCAHTNATEAYLKKPLFGC